MDSGRDVSIQSMFDNINEKCETIYRHQTLSFMVIFLSDQFVAIN
jgi:hypothetical protein